MPRSLVDTGAEGVNAPEYTVTELSGALKRRIEGEFDHIRVRGEVGRVSRPASGHIYLDLKDDRAVLAAVIWKGTAVAPKPEEGMEVVATGRLTTFPGQSKYQMIIESLAPAGLGALMAMLEKRRAALAAEGLFDADRKRALPYLPRVIGVVTSPTGAVIQDILHRLADRFPVRVLVWPVVVQGERCAPEVAAAINGFSRLAPGGPVPRPDVLIVARGGGSVEDLWGFNDEAVVRAAAACSIPLISAVGHETDTTLIDHAADRRAPTPSAAAEMAVPVRAELLAAVADLAGRQARAVARGIDLAGRRLRDLARALPRPQALVADRRQRLDVALARLDRHADPVAARDAGLRALTARLPRPASLLDRARLALARAPLPDPRARIAGAAHRLEAASARLPQALAGAIAGGRLRLVGTTARLRPALIDLRAARDRLAVPSGRLAPALARGLEGEAARLTALARVLGSLGPAQTLARGFAVVRDAAGGVLTRAGQGQPGARVRIEFADAALDATLDPAAPSRPARPKRPPGGQGSLF